MELVIIADFPDTLGVLVLVVIGLVSVGFLLGVAIGRRWALVVLPLLLAVVVVLTRTMHVTASVPALLVYGSASLAGTWLGIAARTGVRRPSSR